MFPYVVQLRRGTAKQWAEKSMVIPLDCELVIEVDEETAQRRLKIGDGVNTFADLSYLQAGDEVITQAVAKTQPRVVTITLDKDKWSEIVCDDNPDIVYYGQIVELDDIAKCHRLDLQPSVDMFAEFQNLKLKFITENYNGVVTVYSIGDMPTKSYTMQAAIVEVKLEVDSDKIFGVPV